MKSVLIFGLLLIFNFSKAQESQSDIAKKWDDGEYDYYKRWTYKNGDEPNFKDDFSYSNKVKLSKYLVDNSVLVITVDYGSSNVINYSADQGGVQLIRYYRSREYKVYEEEFEIKEASLFVTSKGIWVVNISLDESKVEITGFIGKKAPSGNGIQKEIVEFLASTKSKQAEQRAAFDAKKDEESKYTATTREITFIDIKLLGIEPDALVAGSEFTVGVVTSFATGDDISSKNLGGNQKEGEYTVEVLGADWVGDKFVVKKYCEDLVDNQSIEVIVTYAANTANFKTANSKRFDVTCERDPKVLAKEKEEDLRVQKFKTAYADYIEKAPLVLPKQTISQNSVNEFTGVDTIYYKNEKNRNLGMLKDGNDIILLQANITESSGYRPTKAGVILKKISKVNGKYEVTTGTGTSYELGDDTRAVDYSQLMKGPNGYVVCTSQGLTFFKKDLSFDFHSKSGEYFMLNAVQIGDKNEYGILAVARSNSNFYVTIYNADTKTYSSILPFGTVSRASSIDSKIFYISDGSLLVAYSMAGSDKQTMYKFAKLDIEKMKVVGQDSFDDCEIFGANMKKRRLLSMIQEQSGSIMAVNYHDSGDGMESFETYVVNPFANTYREFSKSWTTSNTTSVLHYNSSYFKYLPNGYAVSYGQGQENFRSTMTIGVYDRKFKQIGYYRIPGAMDEQLFKGKGNAGGTEANQFTEVTHFDTYSETEIYDGLEARYYMDANSNIESFSNINYLNSVFDVYPGETDNELLILTTSSIIKVDLKKSVPSKWVMEEEAGDTSSDDSSSDDTSTDDGSGSNTNTTKINTTKTNADSESGSTTKEKEYAGSVYFKFNYDTYGKSPSDKLYIHYGSNAAYKASTTPGNYATIKCQKGKVYYSFTGEKKDMKEIMELSVEDCGKTFKYTEFK